MYRLRRPSETLIESHLAARVEMPLSYDDVGSTLTESMPEGWLVNHHEVVLGMGDRVWSAAKASIDAFAMFDIDWVDLVPSTATMTEGEVLATMARICGIWTVNPCRIISVVDEPNRYGFAYGTLIDHAMAGEERFVALRDAETGEVRFDITSFSRPKDWVATLTLPMVRSIQRRFVRESCLKLHADVKSRIRPET